jgi:hypothetical protein
VSGRLYVIEGQWGPWFAWRPVKDADGTRHWLHTVERRRIAHTAIGIVGGSPVSAAFTTTEYRPQGAKP